MSEYVVYRGIYVYIVYRCEWMRCDARRTKVNEYQLFSYFTRELVLERAVWCACVVSLYRFVVYFLPPMLKRDLNALTALALMMGSSNLSMSSWNFCDFCTNAKLGSVRILR